jgi:hypothetical protein
MSKCNLPPAMPRPRKELSRRICNRTAWQRKEIFLRCNVKNALRGDKRASCADKRPIKVGGTAARNRPAQKCLGWIMAGEWKEGEGNVKGSDRTVQDLGRWERPGRQLADSLFGRTVRVPGLSRGGLQEREGERGREKGKRKEGNWEREKRMRKGKESWRRGREPATKQINKENMIIHHLDDLNHDLVDSSLPPAWGSRPATRRRSLVMTPCAHTTSSCLKLYCRRAVRTSAQKRLGSQ